MSTSLTPESAALSLGGNILPSLGCAAALLLVAQDLTLRFLSSFKAKQRQERELQGSSMCFRGGAFKNKELQSFSKLGHEQKRDVKKASRADFESPPC